MDLQRIRVLAKTYGGGIKKLAADIEMTEANFHRCLNKNQIQAHYLERLAKIFGVPIGYFFDESGADTKVSGRDFIEQDNSHHHGTEYKAETITVACAENADAAILAEKVKSLETLLAEKERTIRILMQQHELE